MSAHAGTVPTVDDRELEAARARMALTLAAYTGRPCERLAGPCEGCAALKCPTCTRRPSAMPAEPFHHQRDHVR